MLIYNNTITLDNELKDEWVEWVVKNHIPAVMATGMFISYRLGRLLDHDHPDAEIYTIQYLVQDIEHLHRYMDEFSEPIQLAHKAQFEGRYAIFRTVMEYVASDEGNAI